MEDRRIDVAALLLRLSLGAMFVAHGLLKVDIARWPSISQYMERIAARPGVREALREEHLLKAAA